MISATYQSSTTFTVEGSHVEDYPRGRPILAIMLTGNQRAIVSASIYQSGPDTTLVSVNKEILTDTLTEIRLSPTYVDPNSQSGNLAEHTHSADWDGGEGPFARFTSNDLVDALNDFAELMDGASAKEVFRRNNEGTAFEFAALALGMLSNVEIVSPADGQTLKFESATSKWKNAVDLIGGGSGSGSVSWASYYMGL